MKTGNWQYGIYQNPAHIDHHPHNFPHGFNRKKTSYLLTLSSFYITPDSPVKFSSQTVFCTLLDGIIHSVSCAVVWRLFQASLSRRKAANGSSNPPRVNTFICSKFESGKSFKIHITLLFIRFSRLKQKTETMHFNQKMDCCSSTTPFKPTV